MLKIQEGAVWPPKPEQVDFDANSWQTLHDTADGPCTPRWARVTEVGSRIGSFLAVNMDAEAASAIANGLAERIELEETRQPFLTGVRNSINIAFDRRNESPRLHLVEVADEARLTVMEAAA